MNVSLRQIEAFLTAADLGSFTRAARKLHVSQPTLSLLVRDLEAALSLRLFDRTTRRVELTAAGETFRNSIEGIPTSLQRAVQKASDVYAGRAGRIVVAAPPLLATAILPRAIAAFRQTNPGVSVGIIDDRTELILHKIRSGDADCGIGTFQRDEEGIVSTPVGQDQLLLFCNASSPFARKRVVEWTMLRGEAVITLTQDSGVRHLIEVGFETAGVPFHPPYEVTQITTAIALVEAGLGVAVLPTFALSIARGQNLMTKSLVSPRMMRDIAIIRREGRAVPPMTAAFSKVLREHAKQAITETANLARLS
jgi:DNA-binding transcriptional LysR family regulator